MEANYGKPLTNALLAKHCALSEDYFIRRFRNATGLTPHKYLNNLRAQKAARLLVFSSNSIEEIAETCGFSDRYHFSKVFASLMGHSPARYRHNQP